jgi:hypothetical protein
MPRKNKYGLRPLKNIILDMIFLMWYYKLRVFLYLVYTSVYLIKAALFYSVMPGANRNLRDCSSMVRAPPCHGGSCGFESRQSRFHTGAKN